MLGGAAADTLIGDVLNNTLSGNDGNDVLNGRAGDDVLIGGLGNDTIDGGLDQDVIRFNTALGATNIDTVNNFVVVDDTIQLDNAVFTALTTTGVLNADAFHVGTAAADAEDRIIYNSANGNLFYDANGTGAGGLMQFAKLGAGLALTNTDFVVV